MGDVSGAADWPCGACGERLFDCFNSVRRGGGPCCGSCDKHGFVLTARGQAALQALDEGWSMPDALVLHGKNREDT